MNNIPTIKKNEFYKSPRREYLIQEPFDLEGEIKSVKTLQKVQELIGRTLRGGIYTTNDRDFKLIQENQQELENIWLRVKHELSEAGEEITNLWEKKKRAKDDSLIIQQDITDLWKWEREALGIHKVFYVLTVTGFYQVDVVLTEEHTVGEAIKGELNNMSVWKEFAGFNPTLASNIVLLWESQAQEDMIEEKINRLLTFKPTVSKTKRISLFYAICETDDTEMLEFKIWPSKYEREANQYVKIKNKTLW